ncbi:MAG TPA: lasso peptide biosynthesis protein [Trinickia sp.]|uniref:lasso peptide biosynthesis protein n=1 Tax=Trinickia sp. TaxID=2571163 RepID=UPI002CFE0620|nr:lasso peptide biosynthesis protein [Trinickia sp.]HVW52266.1 lasso peptide biosynthesis protein [Trinickia sp.]
MKYEQSLLLVVHSLVRAILISNPIDPGYLMICKAVFPGYVLQPRQRWSSTAIVQLERICDDIYRLDGRELSYASCYSACITAQAIGLIKGIRSEIVLGVKKQDEKLVGHAWLECNAEREVKIITPGKIATTEFTEIKRLNPEKVVQNWITNRATLDTDTTARPQQERASY